jgi:DNA phosphorothioation-dependent restriction protein DptH
MQQIRQLDKHYSLYVNGEKQVSKIQDKPFWELCLEEVESEDSL